MKPSASRLDASRGRYRSTNRVSTGNPAFDYRFDIFGALLGAALVSTWLLLMDTLFTAAERRATVLTASCPPPQHPTLRDTGDLSAIKAKGGVATGN